MSKMNWGKHKYVGVTHTSKRTAALKFEARDRVAATEKQINFLKKLGAQLPKNLSKLQASQLIEHHLKKGA